MIQSVRAVLFAAWFYGVTFAFCTVGLAVRRFAPQHGLVYAQTWVRAVFAGLRPIGGIKVVITGLERLPQNGPALLASQHQSEFDTLIWMTLLKQPTYVTKAELTRIPLFGPMLMLSGMIAVDRKAGAAALRQLLTDTAQAIEAGRQIVIFPEGTRVPPGEIVPLQPGVAAIAARLKLPVYPVATDSGRHWTRSVLGRTSGTIHVAVGHAIACDTPRPELMKRIETFWRRTENASFELVDKPVELMRPITDSGAQTEVKTL